MSERNSVQVAQLLGKASIGGKVLRFIKLYDPQSHSLFVRRLHLLTRFLLHMNIHTWQRGNERSTLNSKGFLEISIDRNTFQRAWRGLMVKINKAETNSCVFVS